MSGLQKSILDCIGNTSLCPCATIVPANGAGILLKLESENPTGSMKDRMALAMIEAAEADGRLRRTARSSNIPAAAPACRCRSICAVKGYPLHIVTSDAFAREKLDHMRILGAKLQIVPSESGRMTEKLTRDMIEAAARHRREDRRLLDRSAEEHATSSRPITRWPRRSGPRRTGGSMGSSRASARRHRCAASRKRLRRHNEQIRIVAVEPAESPVLSGGRPGAHKIDGIGAGFVVPLWQDGIADQIEQVSTEEAMAMAIRLAREEGLFAGTSTGANVIAALRLAERLGPGATIVTVMCDTGMKYLKTYAESSALT